MLGGDRCLALGASLSFPILFSKVPLGIRGQCFYNMGNVWNTNTSDDCDEG